MPIDFYLDNQWINEALIPVNSAGNLTIIGYAKFDGNGLHGLDARSNGNITIANLNANYNGGSTVNGKDVGGAYLDAKKPGIGIANVTLTGFNNFNENSFGRGLTVYADGIITISNLTADQNWNGGGAYLNNFLYGSSTSPQAVTLSGNNSFWHNFKDGLEISSLGAVLLNNVDASDNGIANDWVTRAGPEFGWGVFINNLNESPLYVKPVTLTGTNTFNGNWNSGLEILSTGLVTLFNVTAKWNGTYYEASPAYSYPGGHTYVGCGQFIDNGASDFYVGCGAYIDNSNAFTPLGVTLIGANVFQGNTHTGLTVISKGLINLSNVSANNNGWFNSVLDASPDTVFGYGAWLNSTIKGVTLTGTNTFDGNWDDGLFVNAFEAITINNLEANNNGWIGAKLDNRHDLKHANVTITGFATTEGNGNDGLYIFTNGTVSLINVNANWNTGNGTDINANDNLPASQGGSPANVSILGANSFSGNSGDGLYVTSDGVIALNNISANWNGGTGAYLDNVTNGYWTPLPAVKINLTGVNTFNGNGSDGLFFDATGNVMMTKVTADQNGGNGVFGNATGKITLTCGSMNSNTGGRGYDLNAGGIITLVGVNEFSNFTPKSAISPLPVVNIRACPLP